MRGEASATPAVRLAKFAAILLLSVLPLGLIEIGLRITGSGPPTGLFVKTADPGYLFVNPHFTDVYHAQGLFHPGSGWGCGRRGVPWALRLRAPEQTARGQPGGGHGQGRGLPAR